MYIVMFAVSGVTTDWIALSGHGFGPEISIYTN